MPNRLPAERVTIAISAANQRLREAQSHLNYFLWTSEIAYGYALDTASREFPDHDLLASDAFASVTTAAWYPTNQGRLKYKDTVGALLDHIRQNTIHVYRAVTIFFASVFESYLEERLRPYHLQNRGRGWGPYTTTLAIPELLQAPHPVELRVVLCADICRRLRNCMVHPPFKLPTTRNDPMLKDWWSSLFKVAKQAGWPEAERDSDLTKTLNWCFSRVIGEAEGQALQTRKAKKDLPIELFYTLFNFTNLDSLGFQIEEALIPVGSLPEGRGERKKEHIRRDDLIVSPRSKVPKGRTKRA